MCNAKTSDDPVRIVSVRTLCFLISGKNILLANKNRGHGEGKLNGYGGKIEPGESIKEAAVREVIEESTVTPKGLKPAAIVNYLMPYAEKDIKVYVYICNDWQGEPQSTEEMTPLWFDLNKIPFERMWANDNLWLPEILNGRNFEVYFNFLAEGNLKDFHTIEKDFSNGFTDS